MNLTRRAFSMLETSIAVAILGVGLVMVAAVFPVALTQHQNSSEQAAALELVGKAEAILKSRINTSLLYVPSGTPVGVDTPWYMLPTMSLTTGATSWDPMQQTISNPPTTNLYANLINGFSAVSEGATYIPEGNIFGFLSTANYPVRSYSPRQAYTFGLDQLSDHTLTPFTDEALQEAPNRLVWTGFYRRLANGSFRYAIVVCKQRRNQVFAEQNMGAVDASLPAGRQTPFNAAQGLAMPDRRLPMPWRVTVGYLGGHLLTNRPIAPVIGAGAGLATLAPVGSKMMIQGTSYPNGVSGIPMPAGRVLTVARAIDDYTVETLEDITELPGLLLNGTGTPFDLWVVPPPAEGNAVLRESPAILWRANL